LLRAACNLRGSALRLITLTSQNPLEKRAGEPSFSERLRRGPSNSAGAQRRGFARYASRNPVVKRRRDLAVFRVLLHQRVRSSPVSPGLADTLMALCSSRADICKPVWLNGDGEHCFQCRRAPEDPRDVANTHRQRRWLLCAYRALRACVQTRCFRTQVSPHGVFDLPPPLPS
jgi:hypothetical protein